MTCKQGSGCCEQCGPVTVNATVTGEAKLRTHDGKQVLVVPVVAIVEGVLNGALVTQEEFGKFSDAWEGVPVPVTHPEINGHHVSSSKPDIIESRVIGRFHNVQAADKKLRGELWIDVDAATRKGFESIVNAFQAGEIMEVSTAYFADTEMTDGIYGGKRYSGIHRNLRPDHLAILPNEQGACSVADGCGTFRNNEQGSFMSKAKEALKTLAAMVGINLGTETMTKAEKIELLLNSKKFAEADKPGLELMSEPAIDSILAHAEKPEDKEEMEKDDKAKAAADDEEEKPEMAKNSKPQLDAETLTAVNWAKEQYQENHGRLVAKLKANSRCAFDEAELKAMHIKSLEKLDASLGADYSSRGFPVTHKEHSEEPLTVEPVVLKAVEAK